MNKFISSIFLILLSHFAHANNNACWPLYAFLNGKHGVYGPKDFPIELLYPNEKIYPGKVNRESLAFRQWRHHTPEHIPDEAFNAHYLSREELELDLARKAGFASAHATDANLNKTDDTLMKLPPNCLEILQRASSQTGKFKSIALSRYLRLPGASEILNLAKTHSGGSPQFLKSLGIQPKLSKEKVLEALENSVKGFSHKYFVDSRGIPYLLSTSDQKKIMSALNIPSTEGLSHPQLAALVFGDSQEPLELIGVGYFEVSGTRESWTIKTDVDLPMMNTNVLDFVSYFREFLSQATLEK